MQSQNEGKPSSRPSAKGWLEFVIAGAAVLISAISLHVALSANQTQERLLAASTWPFVQYGTGNRLDDGTAAISFNLYNAGVGPARLKVVQVLYGSQPMPDAAALLLACCTQPGAHSSTITSHPERVLVPGEDVTFLRVDQAQVEAPMWEALNRERFNVQIRACYCSVLNACWMLDSTQRDPQPVATCPTLPAEQRFRG